MVMNTPPLLLDTNSLTLENQHYDSKKVCVTRQRQTTKRLLLTSKVTEAVQDIGYGPHSHTALTFESKTFYLELIKRQTFIHIYIYINVYSIAKCLVTLVNDCRYNERQYE